MSRAPKGEMPDPSDDSTSNLVGVVLVILAVAWCIAYAIVAMRAWLF